MKHIKPTRWLLLLGCLVLSPAAFGQTILFSDDFETENFDGAQGIGLHTWTLTQNGTTTITDVQDVTVLAGSFSARAFDDSATLTAQAVASYADSSLYGSEVAASWLVQPVNDVSFSGTFTLRSLNTSAVQIRFLQSSNQIQYRHGSGSFDWTNLMAYTSGTTYSFLVEMDFDADTYDISVNGGVVQGGLSMLNALDGLDRFAVQSGFAGASEGTFYFDNVLITAVPEPAAASAILLGGLMLAVCGRRLRKRAS